MNQRSVLKTEESHPDRPHPKKMFFSQSSDSVLILPTTSSIFMRGQPPSLMSGSCNRDPQTAIMLVKQQQEVDGHPVLQGGLPSYFLI